MISKTEVVGTLARLEGLFDDSILTPATYPQANYFGKLAVLEVSGWLEACVEKIYEELATPKLTIKENKSIYKGVVSGNHGFGYDEYFKKRLAINLIGLIHIEKMELALGSTIKFQEMKAALNTLIVLRGNLAHNHLTGTAAVSVQTVRETIRLFNQAIAGLTEVEKYLKKIKFN